MTSTPDMSMSSLTGKRILSLVRDGDFAHPGEADAVDRLVQGLPRDPSRRVLDLGCGLGGTAKRLADGGYGHVTGVDVDPDTVGYAQQTYPGQSFFCAAAVEINQVLHGPFDAIVMFNSFYCFPDQERVLQACRALAHAGTEMRIFEYSAATWSVRAQEFCARYARGHWKPLVVDEVERQFLDNGWYLTSREDLSAEYLAWYRALLSKIEERRERIVQASNETWYRYAHERYADLLRAIEDGTIGGGIFRARPA